MAIEVSSNSNNFDCQKCKYDHYCGDDKKSFPQSVGVAKYAVVEIKRAGLVFELESCPLPMITARSRYFFQLFRDYKRGNLLKSGGVYDQPNVYMQAMRILSDY